MSSTNEHLINSNIEVLADYLLNEEFQGYSEEQLKQYLLRLKYDEEIINKAIIRAREKRLAREQAAKQSTPTTNNKQKKQTSINEIIAKIPKKYLLMAITGIIAIIILLTIMWYLSRPVCGNGIKEEGETILTCCEDAGCLGDQTCVNNVCIEPQCGNCQYLENHQCKNYECCNDSDCEEGMICQEHECKEQQGQSTEKTTEQTQECEYACCNDSDCDDNNPLTIDICVDPKTKTALCVNKPFQPCNTNSDCDDDNPKTDDVCKGTPKRCTHITITECLDNDGYCPTTCDASNDNDCQPEVNDQCSNNNDCDDGNPATIDTCTNTKPRVCDHQLTTECVDNDYYCPPNCDYNSDKDCPPTTE